MADERGLQIVSTDLKIGDEDLVKLGVSQYGMQVLAQEQKIQKLIKEGELRAHKLTEELDASVKNADSQKKLAQDVAAAIVRVKELGLRRLETVTATAEYHDQDKGVEGNVIIHIGVGWRGGSMNHMLQRKLTKKEKELIRARDAVAAYIKKLQESLLEIKAIQGRYPMLADHIRGNVTRAKLAKVAPELLKTVEINLPEFALPELPKLNALPAPK